jgi:hypothetical protein
MDLVQGWVFEVLRDDFLSEEFLPSFTFSLSDSFSVARQYD